MKKLISVKDVELALGEGKSVIYVDNNTLITPAARDVAAEMGLIFTPQPPREHPFPESPKAMTSEKSQALGMDGEMLFQLLKQILNKGTLNSILESLKQPKPYEAETAGNGAKVVRGNSVRYDVFDTGNPQAKVTYQELISKEESSMSAGFLTIDQSQFDWTLSYQEVDYVIEGTLTVTIDGKTLTAYPGDVVFVPAGSKVTWGSPDRAKVFYVTYPANWADL